ncbi:MBL fold metallo-hydrolase [Hymenobacter busanensis]|uniref:MBL fold metallo-hydrolase n=1 Tax=Hymenobacter busanensis TaxID=2607656 RepID=A0A7L5A4Z9_9BACT|nr:MBL fold metallo-hydrolase [Hymenobacter busanensis]KAA9338146.1 MBL fold metallo-hydrolase [Hymenobacter busanensis]QHJ09430.1 MBL fold metallo-hydrolase [Hymenobacter busanensis]
MSDKPTAPLARPTRATTPDLQYVAPGVWGLRNVFVNLYFVRQQPSSGPWVLVDAGLPGSAAKIRHTAETLFGAHLPPAAIILTHGHFDHAGALETLASAWDVPVYAHPLELPYLTGRSAYPPPDPTVGGGAMAALSFAYPKHPYNVGSRAHALPADGSVPELPGWRWLPTPGHTPGHVSFFRDEDRVLLAGDAFCTVQQESALAVWAQEQEVHGPPRYFTCDWQQARRSVALLADLKPAVAATGHGIPMRGGTLQRELQDLALHFDELAVPAHGRYVPQPAVADETGVVSVPPAVFDPTNPWLLGAAAAALGLAAAVILTQRRSRKSGKARRRLQRNQRMEESAFPPHADSIDPFEPDTRYDHNSVPL